MVLFILPQTGSITHIRRTGNRIHHLRYGSFWLLSSSIYKWVFSAAAGAETLPDRLQNQYLSSYQK